jgi:iron complex outermembrane receptor protein
MINVLAIFRKLVLLTTLLLFFQMTYGQGTVSGKVTDAGSNPLIGAYVSLEGTEIGSSTDVEGRYSLTVPSGEQRLSATYIGYGTQTLVVTVPAGGNVQLDFVLNEDAIGLDELVVTGTFSGRSQKNSPISMTVLNARQLSELSFNSQADILRNIPGITAEGGGGEVASNVFVRGMPSGGQYQFTPLQVDGLPTISTFGLNSSAHDVYFRNDIGIRNLEFVRVVLQPSLVPAPWLVSLTTPVLPVRLNRKIRWIGVGSNGPYESGLSYSGTIV